MQWLRLVSDLHVPPRHVVEGGLEGGRAGSGDLTDLDARGEMGHAQAGG
jgi:hypothetical protein